MSVNPTIVDDGRTITVKVPISIRKRGGRKLVLAPDGANVARIGAALQIDGALVKAIARAFRWREMLEGGEYPTIREIARAEKINEAYVGRVLRLTLLAPEIIETILNGRQPLHLQLQVLKARFPLEWAAQRVTFRLIPEVHRLKSCLLNQIF
jgi:hypothetical protein